MAGGVFLWELDETGREGGHERRSWMVWAWIKDVGSVNKGPRSGQGIGRGTVSVVIRGVTHVTR